MRHLLLSVLAAGLLSSAGAAHAAIAPPVTVVSTTPSVQMVQYYEPGWREREEWRRRREFEFHRREEFRRREEWLAAHRYPPQPLPYYGYGPRY